MPRRSGASIMTPQEREELRQIQKELRQPLAPAAHKIRELPGTSDLYIYLPWQAVRDRLEEVVPDYQLDFDDPVYDHTTNLVSIKATIEILGVKKSAIAATRISIISRKGNNAEIGHCIDRLHAEAIKNVGEAWCIGRYLDEQVSVYKMLWDSQSELDPEMRGRLNQMKVQFAKQMREYTTPQKPPAPANVTPIAPKVEDLKAEALYPQHNALIKQVRTLTGHPPDEIIRRCMALGVESPSQASPDKIQQLAIGLALDWGASRFESRNSAQTSLMGKVNVYGHERLGEAIANWIESVELMPATK